MAPTILARIAIRLVSIYLLSQALIYLPGLLALPELVRSAGASQFSVVQVALGSILPLVLGLALWIGALPLSRMVVGPVHENEGSATAIEVQTVAISTAGLILLFVAIPRLASSFYIAVVETPQFEGVRYYNDGVMAMLLGAGLQVFLAVLLIVGARFWPRLLRRIRTYGINDERRVL